MRPRVAVTGIGTFCCVAADAAGFTAALREGRRGFVPLDDPRLARLRATHAGLIGAVEPDPDDPPSVRVLDRNVHLALRSLREALDTAGLRGRALGPRGGVVFGTCSGGMLSIERHYQALAEGRDPLDEDLLFSKRYYTTAKVLAWAAGATGPVLSVVTACAAGSGAIAQGGDLIRIGMADVVAAGGSDSFSGSTLVGFDALKATAEGMCAPFSNPTGLNLGEGSAFLILERMDAALARGARILGEVLGSGLSNDAYHPTAPDPSARGQLASMGAALADAGISPERIDYVNAHGTGTRANDPAETRAISKLLGARTPLVPVSSTKSMIGHCLGGAGALEASATLLGARAGFVPPTAGFAGPREGCDLDCVPDFGRPWSGRLALSNSFGFAGNNACLVLDVLPEAGAAASDLPEPPGDTVVITGAGFVTPRGLSLGAPGQGSAAAAVSRFTPPAAGFAAALVPAVDPREVDRRLDLKGMDLCSRYAALAVRQALEAADLRPRPKTMEDVGLVLGISTGPGEGEAQHLRAVFEDGFDLQRLGQFPYVVPNEVAGNVARAMLIKGHSTVIAGGPGAGLVAAMSTFFAVSLGHGRAVLAAAADELTERSAADGYVAGQWGPGSGIFPGEGAAAMLMESGTFAAARGAKVLARVLGCALSADASDPRTGDGRALARMVVAEALEKSKVTPRRVAAISLAAAGDPAPQHAAIREILGEGAGILSTTPELGYAEACGPLFDLGILLQNGAPGSVVVCAFTSPEGLAGAMVLELA